MRALRDGGRRLGAAAVELAILLPVFCVICLIVTDYARLFYALSTITDAARAGAMYYATHTSAGAAAVQQVALADASNLTPAPTVTVTSGPDGFGNNYVHVTVSYEFSTVTIHPGIPSHVTLQRKVVMMANPF